MGDEARQKAQRRVDQIRAMYDRHGVVFHIAWIAAAVVIILAGLAMTVLPGPAMVVLPLGVAMLAVVFGWARRLLLFAADEGDDAAHAWSNASAWMKAGSVVTVAAVVVGIAAWIIP